MKPDGVGVEGGDVWVPTDFLFAGTIWLPIDVTVKGVGWWRRQQPPKGNPQGGAMPMNFGRKGRL